MTDRVRTYEDDLHDIMVEMGEIVRLVREKPITPSEAGCLMGALEELRICRTMLEEG